jgi:outer membrane protein
MFFGHEVAAEDGLRVALAARDQAAEHLRLVSERVEAGVVLAADRMRAQVALSERELALVGSRHLVRVANGNLNTVMGLPVETTLVKLEHADIFTEIPLEEALETCFDLALKQRPELLAARNRVAARRAGVEQAKSAFMPQVTGVARYGRRDDDFAPSDTDSAVGVTIELPLFTGFERGHQLDRNRHELRSSEAEMQAAILRIRSEVWEARSRLTEAQAAVAAATALAAEAVESLRLEKSRYESGASGISDLLDAQTSLTRAEGAASSARWALYISLAEWQHALGTPSARRP